MSKYGLLLAVLFAGGFALPVAKDDDDGRDISIFADQDMAMFFDHTVADVDGRIVGGNRAANGAYPWMAVITLQGRTLVCGASLATARHLVTAAHCVVAIAPAGILNHNVRIVVGTNRWNRGGDLYSLSRHLIHPNYNANTIKNDIGVLTTFSNVVMNNLVRTIPMNYDFVGGGIPARVSGFGLTVNGAGFNSNYLQELRVNTVDGQRCIQELLRIGQQNNTRYPPVDPNVEICTFIGINRGTCNGDSGSALVRNSNNQQIGVVSWGVPCARGAPDMFARVSAYRTWLQNALR